ncbi:MAG: efflux RND transporter periplasmic adaptor subunit [Chitinispirillales bacterium]|jgi:RND family efflux transporter MFP subunit|nr:efflux RND transporter periplasmic adaptor subunit [Chitinispirillales bacterium]
MKKKHIIVLAILTLTAIGGFTAFRSFTGGESAAPASAGSGRGGMGGPVPVEVAEVGLRQMVEVREFTGTVAASYTYVISAKIPGRLMNINKRIGDPVRANEIVGNIDRTHFRNVLDEVQAQIRVSEASLEEARAQLAHTERELGRTQGLVDKGIAAQAELDGLQTQLETQRSRYQLAKAQIEQRQILLNQAQTSYDYTQVRAPERGLVAQRHVDGGTLMSVGMPILTVVGLDTVFVELAVTERDYQKLSPGKMAVVTTDAIPGRTFEGVVHRMAPFFQAASRTAVVEIALRNRDHLLKPGMFARINITLSEEDAARAVPATALIERDGRYSVFVVSDSATAKRVPVEVGIKDDGYAQILSPADLDGPIVTLGQHLLRDGSRVVIPARS